MSTSCLAHTTLYLPLLNYSVLEVASSGGGCGSGVHLVGKGRIGCLECRVGVSVPRMRAGLTALGSSDCTLFLLT